MQDLSSNGQSTIGHTIQMQDFSGIHIFTEQLFHMAIMVENFIVFCKKIYFCTGQYLAFWFLFDILRNLFLTLF